RQPPFNPYFWHTRNHLTDRGEDLRLSEAAVASFQNSPQTNAFSYNSLRRDVQPISLAPEQRLPNGFEPDFAYERDIFENLSQNDEEVRQRFNSLLNLSRDNQFLNDLDRCRDRNDQNWIQNDFEMENAACAEDMKENSSIYKCINSYSDLAYDKCQNFEDTDSRYGFFGGVEVSNKAHESQTRNEANFERNDGNADRWQTKNGLNRWSPPRDTNHRFRNADAWVTFQNA
ncbi:hypothetical protein Trydic_g11993, partial [Trypoxylus dichotomus]